MKKVEYVCNECREVFVSEYRQFLNPDCPVCGSYETEVVDDVVKNLTEYEASQEQD